MTDFKFGSCFNIYFFYLQCNVTSLGPAATVILGHISQSGDPVEQIAQLVNIEVGHHPPLLGILARLPASGLGQAVHARAHQQRLQVAVLAEQNVRVGSVDKTRSEYITWDAHKLPPVPDHECAGRHDARVSPRHDLEHELARLAQHHRLPPRRRGHGRHHGARAWYRRRVREQVVTSSTWAGELSCN